jgi:type III pantothenate kinase
MMYIPPRRLLLIDVSNSFTKVALSDGNSQISDVKRIATKDLCETTLRAVAGASLFNVCVFCSVVPSKNETIRRFSQHSRIIQVDVDSNLGATIDLPEPKGVGADRLANVAFAAARCDLPAVVVDVGTATTFDVILQDRRFVGGVIAPGPDLMCDYLNERTALLPKIELREPDHAIGRSTGEALLAGAIFGYRGMVRGILDRIRAEISDGFRVHVLGTGGGAEIVRESLAEIIPNLTLEGLRLIGQRS